MGDYEDDFFGKSFMDEEDDGLVYEADEPEDDVSDEEDFDVEDDEEE